MTQSITSLLSLMRVTTTISKNKEIKI